MKNRFFGFWFGVGFGVVNKKPNDVKHARKPGDNENNVQRFNVIVHNVNGKWSIVNSGINHSYSYFKIVDHICCPKLETHCAFGDLL